MRNIAKRLEEHCRELERMAKNGSYRVVENEKRAEAYNYLGKLRARESVELLLDNIDFDCVTNLLPMYFRNKPAADALVEIGNPHVFDAIVKRVCADSRPSKAISPMYAETLRAIEPLDVLRARISVRLKELKNNSTDEKPLANEKSSPAGRLRAFMAENKLN